MKWLRFRGRAARRHERILRTSTAGDRLWMPSARPGAIAHAAAQESSRNGAGVVPAARTADGDAAAAPTSTQRRRPRARALVVLAVAVLGASAGFAAPAWLGPLMQRARTDWLSLRTIAVAGATDRVTSGEIAAATGIEIGRSLLDLDPAAIETKLLNHPWVAAARVVRVPPSTLVVSVQLRSPVARIARGAQSTEWLVDDRGHAFAVATSDDATRFPLLVMDVIDAPANAEAALLADGAAAASALLRSTVTRPAQIVVAPPGDPDGLRLRISGLSTEIVLGGGQLDRKFAHLARLLAAEIPGLRAASAIDLRFADQAVLRGLPVPEASAQRAVKPGGADPPSDRRG